MKAKEAIKELTRILSKFNSEKFELTEMKLVDGTAVFVDYEKGEIYVVGGEGEKIPAPVGEHELENGDIIVVVEPGKIAESKKKEEGDKVEIEIEAGEQKKEDAVPAKMEIDAATTEMLTKLSEAIDFLKNEIVRLETELKTMKDANANLIEAQKMSAIIISEIAKSPDAEPIQTPNTFRSQLKQEKKTSFESLQKIFENRKTK